MIWKASRIGKTRVKNKFALIPTRVDGYWIWLESYKIIQEYAYSYALGGAWLTTGYILENKKLAH
jgi:hypothetical protein